MWAKAQLFSWQHRRDEGLNLCAVTWYCAPFLPQSTSPLVRMMPKSSTLAFFSQFSLKTLTFKRLRRTMAAFPATNTRVNLSRERAECFITQLSTFNNLGNLRLVGFKFERCQKAQGTQVERHDRRNALLWMSTGCDSCFDGVNRVFASKALETV